MSDRITDRDLLPPMMALRAFEAAARLGSFTLAAEELHVTQGAVSRQIKLLEQSLHVKLFDRRGVRVMLTEAGQYYAQHVAENLGRLMSAATQTRSFAAPGLQLHIGIVPTFCSRWIIPRLSTFLAQNPRLQLKLSALGGDGDVALDAFDATLVVGRRDWPNAVTHRLESEELIAVASPRWLRAHRVKVPADLIGPPLLVHTARANLWNRWFAENGVDPGALVPATLALDQITMMIEAATAGLGAALLPRALIGRELQAKELAIVRSHALHVNDGFHLVYLKHRERYPPLIAFRDWILGAS